MAPNAGRCSKEFDLNCKGGSVIKKYNMAISVKRLIYIIACMASKGVELIEDTANDECYIFLGMNQRDLPMEYEEIICLREAEIIEVDSGCDEKGYERTVYRLTEKAQEKVQTLVKEEKKRREKLKRLQ